MSSRPDPERLRLAHRAGTVQRLIGEGVTPTAAERLVVAWEARAVDAGSASERPYWEAGWAWIAAERALSNAVTRTISDVSGSLQPPAGRPR